MPRKMQTALNRFAQLVEQVKSGDDVAMSQLMEQYHEPLKRAASQLIGKALRSQLDSADLVQSVQIILWLGLRTGKFTLGSPDSLLALAKTLLRRKVARYWRVMKPQLTTAADPSMMDTVVDQAFYPVSQEPNPQESSEFDDLVEHFLVHLGDLDRQLVKLRFQGYSTADAARHLNFDAGHIAVRLGRLHIRLVHLPEMIGKPT